MTSAMAMTNGKEILTLILCFQGYGRPDYLDDITLSDPNAARVTEGMEIQWHIPEPFVPAPTQLASNSTNWRDLPGNQAWVEAEDAGRLVFELREDDRYPSWHLDGPSVPETGGNR